MGAPVPRAEHLHAFVLCAESSDGFLNTDLTPPLCRTLRERGAGVFALNNDCEQCLIASIAPGSQSLSRL